MGNTTLKFIDASTTTGIRMTSFGATIEDTLKDFLGWVAENNVKQEEIIYADLYEKNGNSLNSIKAIAHLSLDGEGGCIMDKAEDETPLRFSKKRTLLDRIRGK